MLSRRKTVAPLDGLPSGMRMVPETVGPLTSGGSLAVVSWAWMDAQQMLAKQAKMSHTLGVQIVVFLWRMADLDDSSGRTRTIAIGFIDPRHGTQILVARNVAMVPSGGHERDH
ncbi:hypothetical protein [Rhodopirellula sp. P2]|uniref:hypothetical protein n=1 Tax=Rhodopirellula sp. P2 TaxID=2127060 RepID=UPI002368DDA1|nr:hypothetical protein [Rhodopirellula sp. P2]WDQ18713.1 hypothetical protein PSR62_09240 [Rhodopirellula sp. P2]